jgi:hypothetical protein
MPPVVVQDLVLHEADRILFAATHARSVYSYDLNQLPAADGDGDGVDNNSDCALADAGAFSPPGEVVALRLGRGTGDGAALSWASLSDSAGPDTSYDVARGVLSTLPFGGGTGGAMALACDVGTDTFGDSGLPPANTGYFYLIRGENVCGIGTAGHDSRGAERAFPDCS